jgi:hypothetical protein
MGFHYKFKFIVMGEKLTQEEIDALINSEGEDGEEGEKYSEGF